MIRSSGFASLSLAVLLALSGSALLTWSAPALLGHHIPKFQHLPVHCPDGIAKIPRERPLKVMSWNIQFLAGSYYPYWSNSFNQPPLKADDLARNLERIVAIIRAANPDILHLQEVHRTHPVSHHQDQLPLLYERLSDLLPCYSSASYWKARLVPVKHMMGEIDMVLLTMSRYRIEEAHQQILPSTRRARILIPFYPRHSLLESRFPLTSAGFLTTINTHLDAPTLNRGNMGNQLHAVLNRMTRLTEKNRLWFLSGDFNLLPPGFYQHLPDNQKNHYPSQSPLISFYQQFRGIPSPEDLNGNDRLHWLTAYDLNRDHLDLVIDYIFHPHYLQATDSQVLHLPLDISDHMPIVTTFTLPTHACPMPGQTTALSPELGN